MKELTFWKMFFIFTTRPCLMHWMSF